MGTRKPCVVRFREQTDPKHVSFPSRDHSPQPEAARSEIRGPDQGSALDPRRAQLKGPGAGQATPLLGGGRAPAASPAVGWVGYNGSLLCLGHFKEKFSSMKMQPASLAHG